MSIRPRYAFSVVTTFVTFFVWSAAQSNAQDWPRWRGQHFDGVSRETGLLNPWPKEGPRQIWQVKLSGGFSTVAVADGRLFTQTKEGNHEVVLCLDAATGKELWRHRYAVNYDAHVTFTSGPRPDSRTGPRATPTVDGDRVYVMGATGILTALETKTGKVIWQQQMLRAAGKFPIADPRSTFPPAEVPMHGISSSPLVVGQRLYVAPGGPSGKTLAALDKNTGKVIWEALDDGVGHASPIWAEVGGSPQLIFLTATAAVGLAPHDGRLLWRYPWKTTFDLNVATPVVADGQVFISSNYGKGGALETVVPLRTSQLGDPKPKEADPTGLFFYEQTPEALIEAVRLFEAHRDRFDPVRIREHVKPFDRTNFKENIFRYVRMKHREFSESRHA